MSAPASNPARDAGTRRGLLLVALAVLAVAVLHLAIRGAISGSLIELDALENVNSQTWQLVYKADAPPLFNWIHRGFVSVFGPSWFAISLQRYLLLLVYFVFLYLSACRFVADRRHAALFALSASALYQIGWAGHEYVTHSAMLLTMLAVTLWAFLRAAESRLWRDYALLGLAMGLGLLSKYNFPVFPLLLALAALGVPRFRAAVVSWKFALALVSALLFLAPVLAWNLREGWPVFASVSDHVVRSDAGGVSGAVESLLSLAGGFIGYTLPLALIVVAIFGRRLLAPAGQANDHERLFRNLILLGIGAGLIAALGFGADNFQERYMHPFLFYLPLWFAARLQRGKVDMRDTRLLAATLVALAALVLVIRIVQMIDASQALCGRNCRPMEPFDRLAARIEAEGLASATYVSDDFIVAGNLKAQFPQAPALTFERPLVRPPGGGGTCLFVFRTRGADRILRKAPPDVAEAVRRGPVVDLSVDWPHLWRPAGWRSSDFGAVRLDPESPSCR